MRTQTDHPATSEDAIWSRVLAEINSPLTPAGAKLVLAMKLPEKDRRRAYALGQKAQKRELKPSEKAELEAIQRVGMILASLWSKARTSLRRASKRSDAA